MVPEAADSAHDDREGSASYVFTVRFRLEPETRGVSVDPHTFETTHFREEDQPAEIGWLFFRDNLWHGELNDPGHMRALTRDALGVDIVSVEFEELRTDETYLADLREAVDADLTLFRSDTVEEALSKYLGSSIHVTGPTQDT